MDNLEDLIKENTLLKFDSDCVRKRSNWSKSSDTYKFDSEKFDPEKLLKDIRDHSPKLHVLLDKIDKLDAQDYRNDNQYYKHFIFCDLKSSTYGSKLLAAAFMAKGMVMGYNAPLKQPNVRKKKKTASENLETLLDENQEEEVEVEEEPSISPFVEENELEEENEPSISPLVEVKELEVEVEPELERDENGQTETLSAPASNFTRESESEFGANGLPKVSVGERSNSETLVEELEEEPRELEDVELEPSELEEEPEEKYKGGAGPPKKAKRYNKIELLNDADLNKTPNRNFYLLSSVAVFDQPINVANKKSILKKFNQRPENVHGKEVRFIIMDSGFKEGIDLFDIKYIHIFEPPALPSDQKQVIGRGTRTCGQKGLVFHPTRGWVLNVFIYDLKIPEPMRPYFLGAETAFDLYLKSLNVDLRLFRFAADLEDASIFGSVDYELNKKIHSFSINGGGPKLAYEKKPRIVVDQDLSPIVIKNNNNKNPRIVIDQDLSPIVINNNNNPLVVDYPVIPNRLSFTDMREHIKRYFSKFAWDNVKMENLCIDKKGGAGTSIGAGAGIDSGAGTSVSTGPSIGADLIQYTPTQDFVRHYFTPQIPVKGLLLWHSVGTGKTCSAIAAATSTFESQGYTILWVTRTTLKNDIWKNMFDQICNETIRSQIIDRGLVIPTDMKKRMRLLSASWKIRPMSYKQFSNLVSKQNNFYKTLVNINGKEDPLRKTLIIIDEAHKLYGGSDLSSLERPDMNILHESLMNSYRVSGANSVRLLLMTATPITENPMELIRLVNLCKPAHEQIPHEFPAFSQEYLNEDGGFSANGRTRYLDDIAGYISYLNREKDARQFSQPRIQKITPPLIYNVQDAMNYDKRYVREVFNKDISDLKTKIGTETAKIDKELADVDSSKFEFLKDKCNEYEGLVKKGCVKIVRTNIREIIREAKEHTTKIRDDIKTIREEIKNKNLFRNDALKNIADITAAVPEELEKFKETAYYNLKYKCAKKIKSTSAEFKDAMENHPFINEYNQAIAAYDERIRELQDGLKDDLDAHKKRISRIKDFLRRGDLNDLEKSVLRLTIRDDQKTYKKRSKDAQKQVDAQIKDINVSRKAAEKTRKSRYRKLKTTLKKQIREDKAKEKAEARAEKKLRRTMRKQGELREEIQHELLQNLVKKYSTQIDEDFENVQAELSEKAAKKAEENDAKKAEKEEKLAKKAAEKEARHLEKEEKHKQKKADKATRKLQKSLEKAERKTKRDIDKKEAKTRKMQGKIKPFKFRTSSKNDKNEK